MVTELNREDNSESDIVAADGLIGLSADLSMKSRSDTSAVLDAYEEFEKQRELDPDFDVVAFLEQLPGDIKNSLIKAIKAANLFEEFPDLLEIEWPQPGEIHDNFRIIKLLGEGAFAKVFLAEDLEITNRPVALKCTTVGGDVEASILGESNHPNVVSILSSREIGDFRFICMPYRGEATLETIIKVLFRDSAKAPASAKPVLSVIRDATDQDSPHPFDNKKYLQVVRKIAVQIADALDHLHKKGISHQDLKPSNILITKEGVPLLLDFNLSRRSNAGLGVVGGTLPYMAPEILIGFGSGGQNSSPEAAAKADLFSYGVVLYEVLTGKLPYLVEENNQSGDLPNRSQLIQERIQTQTFEPIEKAFSGIDRNFAQVINRCLAYREEHRPESAQQVVEKLKQPATFSAWMKKVLFRHRMKIVAVPTVLLAVALLFNIIWVLTGLNIWFHHSQAEEAIKAERYEDALYHANLLLRQNKNDMDALFLRGKSYLFLGETNKVDLTNAVTDFENIFRKKQDSQIAAAMGYAYQLNRQIDLAKFWYGKAAKLGNESAALLNNVGFLEKDNPKAISILKRAIELNENNQAPYRVLTRIYINKANSYQKGKSIEEIGKSLRVGIDCINKAIKIGPVNKDVYEEAFKVHLLKYRWNNTGKKDAIKYLKLAIQYGMEKEAIRSTLKYSPQFQNDPRVKDLLNHPPKNLPLATRSSILINPLQNGK